jgi:multiple sugar transport system permease protein
VGNRISRILNTEAGVVPIQLIKKRGIFFILPLALFVIVSLCYLFFSAFDISLRNIVFLMDSPLVGFGNFADVFTSNDFWASMKFSLIFSVFTTVIEAALGFFLAYFFYSCFRGKRLLMTLIITPMMIAPSLFGLMSRILFNNFIGIVPNYIRMLFGIDIEFFGRDMVFVTLVLIDVLQWTPFIFLIVYSAMLGVPHQLMEAAKIDGSGKARILFSIIFPYVLPSIISSGFLRFIESFRVFDTIFVLTGGGPGNLTTSISIYIYKTGFSMGRQSVASAAGIILFLIMLVPTIVSVRGIGRSDGRV